MHKILAIGTLFLLLTGFGLVYAQDDISKQPACPYCGMDRAKFAHSRMLLEYDKGAALGTCSIHCAAVDMAFMIDRSPVTIWVGDYKTKKLVDAETVKKLASLPGKEVLLGRLLGSLNSPVVGFVQVLNGTLSRIVRVLDQVRQVKQSQENN